MTDGLIEALKRHEASQSQTLTRMDRVHFIAGYRACARNDANRLIAADEQAMHDDYAFSERCSDCATPREETTIIAGLCPECNEKREPGWRRFGSADFENQLRST